MYATLVRESEEDNENLDGEEQKFIEPPAPSAGDEDGEDTSAGNGEDDEDTSAENGEDASAKNDEDTSAENDEEGSQKNESDDDIMQSGDEFFGEVNEGIGGALGAVGGAVLGANAADWFGAGQGSEEYQAAAKGVEDAAKVAKDAGVNIDTIKPDTPIKGIDSEWANTAAKEGISRTGVTPQATAATKYQDALKNLDSVKAGAPSEVGKFFKNNKWAGAAAGAAGGYAVGSAFDKDDKKNVAETEQPTMTAEEFFGESDSDGWQTPKEFYGEAEEPPIPDDDFFGEGEDHGALTERSAEPGEELMSAEEFLAGDDESLEEGLGSAVGAIGGAALGAYGAPHLKDALPTGTSSEVADAIANPATGAALGAGAGYLAGKKALDRDETNESEDDELMLAEDFFSDDAEDDGEMIPESDFFAEAAAMKA